MLTLPEIGVDFEKLKEEVDAKKAKDIDWRQGKCFALVYYPGKEYSKKISEIASWYAHDNGLNPTAMPSLVEMENEVLEMCNGLFNGGPEMRGHITSGGTESILLSVKTAREWGKGEKKITKPHMVLSESVHPAFFKGFKYFGVDYSVAKNKPNGEADPMEYQKHIKENTVMIIASAPSYPYGIMDPIEEIGKVALSNNVLFHVDACVGGFVLPFMKEAGYDVPKWNFEVPGVTSISADMHKYGYAPKGVSILAHKNSDIRKYQYFIYSEWLGGIYGSPTITGTRPGSQIASAWATLKVIGRKGYVELVKTSMEVRNRIQKGIELIPELEVIGKPAICMLAFKSDKFDVYQLADELNARGWHFDKTQNPASIHLSFNAVQRGHEEDFVMDLKECVDKVKRFSMEKVGNKLQVGLVKGLSKVLPNGALAKFQKGKASAGPGQKSAAMYGMMGALSGSGDLEEIVLDFLDGVYSQGKN